MIADYLLVCLGLSFPRTKASLIVFLSQCCWEGCGQQTQAPGPGLSQEVVRASVLSRPQETGFAWLGDLSRGSWRQTSRVTSRVPLLFVFSVSCTQKYGFYKSSLDNNPVCTAGVCFYLLVYFKMSYLLSLSLSLIKMQC